jgi:hypothetical protein
MFAAVCSFPPLIRAADCDSVLVQQIDRGQSNRSVDFDWLSLINNDNYEQAKHGGSASYYGDLFSAGYNDFNEKRSHLFQQQHLTLNVQDSRESFKSHLDPDQINAWILCQNNKSEIANYFKNIDANGATLYLSWRVTDALGPLNITTVQVPGAGTDLNNLKILKGDDNFTLNRPSNGAAIRGKVTGTFGVSAESRSVDIYLPPFAPPPPTVVIPERMLVPETQAVLKSIAHWGGQPPGYHEDICLKAPDGFDLVIARQVNVYLGPRAGRCLSISPACYRKNEYCEDVVILDGCLVSSKWHAWYKAQMSALGIPYSASAACQANQQ